ncbi:transcriptional regulator with XRE-family HTH domain [Rhizobium rosettiformans]|uniref:Helix-turn-helix transcriptional regulator n=2 Tax=Rhizobium rosettiformans TaxID=1368430 RepID=A0A4S8PPU6_9HYPH|nr:helix-turn-helix transcriptional regulator [Rhizobium rosettiformans]MBB5277707.1 transcriptional regulator with XRE-family HTH domain [Rhizobium rosettiformans]THV33083.1 helix-turn-helix transcriptional regulator [Rhizobium rosettiformans W3]
MENTLSNRIKARLDALNMNATQAAVLSELGKTAVRDIIVGKSKSPTVATLARLAETLQCTVSYLVGDADHPQAFRSSDLEMQDFQIADVVGLLRSGIFQKPPKELVSYGRNVLYGHPIAPEHGLTLFKMGDNSMAGAGILEGDIITVAMPYNEKDFALYKHKYVVGVRYVVPPGLEELSLREVALHDGVIKLFTRPLGQQPDLIELSSSDPVQGAPTLFATTEDHGFSVLGYLIRVTRDFPDV